MARFTYTAERNDGEVYNGVAEAVDRFELYSIVRREGGHIIDVSEDRSDSIWSISHWNSKFSSIKEYDKVLFARNLGAMLSAGLSLARALSVLERQTRNPRLSSAMSQIAAGVRHGDNLSDALGKFPHIFSGLFTAMVKAGEEGGNVSESLTTIADQTERMYVLKKKIRGALIYPCIVLLAIVGIGTLMMTQVVPTLAQTFEEMGAQLPASTQMVITVSNFITKYTVVAIAGLVLIIASIYAALRTKTGKRAIEYVFLHLPGIGPMVKEVNAARTARTLASLSESGVDIITSLSITKEVVQNSHFQEIIDAAAQNVGKGDPLSTEFVRRADLYPAFVGEMMQVGEETGKTAEMLKRLAIYYEDEVDRKTKDMSTIIEPFLMLFIGAGVGFFAVSMITPIYQLSNNI